VPLATFKQYREADGQFYFKLVGSGDTLLLQSAAFAQGRDAGVWVGRFRKEGAAALAGSPVTLAADEATVRTALDRFLEVE
jgi:tryptophanyl-tRNA synthetase